MRTIFQRPKDNETRSIQSPFVLVEPESDDYKYGEYLKGFGEAFGRRAHKSQFNINGLVELVMEGCGTGREE